MPHVKWMGSLTVSLIDPLTECNLPLVLSGPEELELKDIAGKIESGGCGCVKLIVGCGGVDNDPLYT